MKNDVPEIIEVEIEKLVTGGAGLGRVEGRAVFVHGTVPGDRVRAAVRLQKPKFIAADLVEVVEPGPDRRPPPCPHFGDCGGCDLQHLEPARQRALKTDILVDCFARIGKLAIIDLISGPDAIGGDLRYRNKIRLLASPTGHYGLLRRGTHEIVPLASCALLPEQFDETILPWIRTLPPAEQLVLQFDDRGNWLLSMFGPPNRLRVLKKILASFTQDGVPAPGCRGLLFNNLPIWGHDYLVMRLAGKRYRVSARSFFQGNLAVTEAAVTTVREWLAEVRSPGGLLADLCCGVGLFSLALADRFDEVIAVDTDPHAIRDARNNIERDREARGKVTAFKGPIGVILRGPDVAERDGWREGCCVLDPPRTGLDKRDLDAVLGRAPRHIVYMSCDPATLARDTAILVAGGYAVDRVRAFDMFPQTAHLESLVLLTRAEGNEPS